MSPLRILGERLSSAAPASRRFENELAAELRVHLARIVAYNRRAGMTPEAAMRDAERRLGTLPMRPAR